MAKQRISNITVIINGDHIDPDGYHHCNECNDKTMLVSPIAAGEWAVDEECYKSREDSPEDVPDQVFVGEVTGHWCPTCERLVSITYNF